MMKKKEIDLTESRKVLFFKGVSFGVYKLKIMSRRINTNKNDGNWTEAEKLTVWKKGNVIPEYSPSIWRTDKCGKVVKWSEHGNRDSDYGWEIDHINPVSNGGEDDIINLQPLHWENNADKGDKLYWTCP